MRLHPLSIVLSIPAIFLACSSGGSAGNPPGIGPGAFGSPGSNTPALSPPLGGGGGGGGTQNPQPADTGARDTGTGTTDTGTAVTDTGMTSGGVCSRMSKCTDQLIAPATCSAAVEDAACGSLANTYFTCLYDNQTCGSTGATDQEATGAACASQGSAWQACSSA